VNACLKLSLFDLSGAVILKIQYGICTIMLNITSSMLTMTAFLDKAINNSDLRKCTRKRSHKMVIDYLDSGADDEISLKRVEDAYPELKMHYCCRFGLQPRLDLSTTFFVVDVSLPIFGYLIARIRMFHTEGESAAAKAAKFHGADNVCAFFVCYHSHLRDWRSKRN